MEKKKNKKQPIPEKGKTFKGWAVFIWGMSHDRVFRTRADAKDYCCEHGWTSQHQTRPTWEQVKDHMHVARVECKII